MSSDQTENLGLHTWAESDHISREEFNHNFTVLDGLITLGTVEVSGTETVVELGFTPKAVLVAGRFGVYSNSGPTSPYLYTSQGFAMRGMPSYGMNYDHSPAAVAVEIVEGGFRLTDALRAAANPYRYIAFG